MEGTEFDSTLINNCLRVGIPCKNVDLNASNLLLPYDNNQFDVVTCTEVLEHIKSPGKVVKELIRVAKELVLITLL